MYFYLPVYTREKAEKKAELKPVSVIICARNEAENLRNFLPSVLEQDYPIYEVIVVNDCSEDDTYLVLGEFLSRYPHLRVSTITKDPKFTHNKKFAQFIGIKASKHDLLLFTDADCKPVSSAWIEGMCRNFDEKTSYVLGYGGYLKEKGFLNAYIRNETFTIAVQYLGMAMRRIPYMGVGRNLAYRKSEFFNNGGFGLHSHLASGDDDLFVNGNARPENTVTEYSPATQTRSVASSTFEEFAKQKRRHLTTSQYYKPSHKFILVLEPLTRMLFYTIFIVLLSFHYLWIEVLAIFGLRMAAQITVLALAQKKLLERGLIPYSLIFDIISPVVNSILYISKGNPKGRKQGVNQWS
ncbi:MAG TPA: glycosyltransferase [Bacteroidales bacterium]|nr:glycosyltransferase [Bacteroidales bacterium]